jgi:hypothetical protein
VEKRDLFRRPLMLSELKAYQGLVFDPPRAGAEVQVADIARSPIPRIAAVSCNPVTLARDLEILIARAATGSNPSPRSTSSCGQTMWKWWRCWNGREGRGQP